jgi:DNA-directed RNA polymerase specialized sigma24 family protein
VEDTLANQIQHDVARVAAFCRERGPRLPDDEVEDQEHAVFLAVYQRAISDAHFGSRLGAQPAARWAYVYAVWRNLAADRIRKKYRRQDAAGLAASLQSSESPSDDATKREWIERLRRLDHLTEDEQLVLDVVRLGKSRAFRDFSEKRGLDVRTTRRRLLVGALQLRRRLGISGEHKLEHEQ